MIEFLPHLIEYLSFTPATITQAKEMKEQNIQDNDKKDLYPWLDKDDPRRDMTDEEILDKYIDLLPIQTSHWMKRKLL